MWHDHRTRCNLQERSSRQAAGGDPKFTLGKLGKPGWPPCLQRTFLLPLGARPQGQAWAEQGRAQGTWRPLPKRWDCWKPAEQWRYAAQAAAPVARRGLGNGTPQRAASQTPCWNSSENGPVGAMAAEKGIYKGVWRKRVNFTSSFTNGKSQCSGVSSCI